MCGIFGIFTFGRYSEEPERWVQGACDLMAHRGPDDEGIFTDRGNGVHFGHRRLSILDLSRMGHQPLATGDGSLVVTYNGEIYNYLEIRSELIGLGHSFRSETDTEVLLLAYREWGVHCLDRFNGMFAFGIWDRNNRKLLLVRDRLGIKPLYYLVDDFGVAFASEVKAFKAIPSMRFSAEEKYIPAFLQEGYITGEETLFRGVKKVPPGTYMEIQAEGISRRKYWDLSFDTCQGIREKDWKERLESLLTDSVNLRLRSDVPVGIFLSGGLDSTTIVAYLDGKSDIPLKTFSVAYDMGGQYDETPYARLAARRFRTDHYEHYVSPGEFQDFVPRYVWFMDEPVSEAAGISLYYISRLARKFVTVILSGEGSDELFGGYDIYRFMQWMEFYRNLPAVIRKGIDAGTRMLSSAGSRWGKFVELASLPLEKRYRGVSLLPRSSFNGLFADGWKNLEPDPLAEEWEGIFNSSHQWAILNRLLHADTKTWLVDDILIKADKMTMANSLELRVPFLDYRIVELAASMPDTMKINGHVKKYILKELVADGVPQEIIHREKMGFPTPIATMFRVHLNGYLKEILLDRRTLGRGYFSRRGVERAISDHEKGIDRSQLLWRLLVLEEWFRVFTDG